MERRRDTSVPDPFAGSVSALVAAKESATTPPARDRSIRTSRTSLGARRMGMDSKWHDTQNHPKGRRSTFRVRRIVKDPGMAPRHPGTAGPLPGVGGPRPRHRRSTGERSAEETEVRLLGQPGRGVR